MKKRGWIACCAGVLAGAAVVVAVAPLRPTSDGSADAVDGQTGAKTRAGRNIQAVKPTRRPAAKSPGLGERKKAAPSRKPVRMPAAEEDNFSPEERKVADALQAASDDNDFKSAQKAVSAALAGRNPALLRHAVDVCRWFGEKALPELTSIAARAYELSANASRKPSGSDDDTSTGNGSADNESTSAEAEEAWGELIQSSMDGIEMALSGIESDSTKAKLIGEYMKISPDENMLTMLEGQLNGVLDESLAIEVALDVIANGSGAAAEHAKEVYKFQTGEDYTTPEAAKAWIAENYTPPDAE